MTTRIALVGANYGATLASGFADLENATLVAIADPDAAAREAAAKELGIPADSTFETLEDLLFTTEVDALIIASPTHLHERHISAAFDRGLHVLSSSPIGTRSSEVSHVVTSAGLVGKTFMWANPFRFDPRISIAQFLVETGELGEVLSAAGSIQVADWPYDPDSWRLERDLGGGALLEIGTQTLDALWYAMGCPDPVEALAASYDQFSANYASKKLEHPAEDSLTGMVRFKNGASLTISAQLEAALPPGQTQQTLTLQGSRGAIDLAAGQRRDNDGNPFEYATASCSSSQLRALGVNFLQAIETGEEPIANGKQALAFHKMVDALLKSAREKEAIAIKVERTLDDLFGGL